VTDSTKFQFPSRGFHCVADKVAEADYFLGRMKETSAAIDEFRFLFSAFVSAARSITFSLQAVMSRYPGFDLWYPPRQQRLKESKLARFFVDLRNHLQKVGSAPLFYSGYMRAGTSEWFAEFIPTPDFKEVPLGDVIILSEAYFRLLLEILQECYVDYWAYIDPRAIFTTKGLDILGWAIEDVEEAIGFPRGWTDIPWSEEEKTSARLHVLSRYGGDELMDAFFEKYNIGSRCEPTEKI
jgi:hypothetical protein